MYDYRAFACDVTRTSRAWYMYTAMGLTVLIYGTLAYLRIKLFLKTKLTDAE